MPSCVKNVLIVSASIGSGHTQAANAVKAELQRQHPYSRVTVVDFLEGDNFSLTNFIKETYLKMIDVFPHMYDLLYRWSQGHQKGTTVRNIMAWTLKKRMLRLIDDYRPDMIVFTHPFPCGAACRLKRRGHIHMPLAGVITDYAVHRLWVYDEVDMYFVAASAMAHNLVAEGVSANRIQITGIPIDNAFSQIISDQSAFYRSAESTILVMGGGLGLGALEEVLLQLDTITGNQRIVVVAGRNDALRKELQSLSRSLRHTVSILGYTQRIPELMANADLLVTKPGALTCSEAMVTGLPMVLVNAIPGQEEDNAHYLHNHHAALWVQDETLLAQVVSRLLSDPSSLATMRYQAQQLGRPDAAQHIVRQLSSMGMENVAQAR